MDFDISEILSTLSPLTLTTAISLIKTDEPFILKSRLGKNVQTMYDDACVFEVEEGSYNLAPVGFPNDPPSLVNISRKRKRYSVVPDYGERAEQDTACLTESSQHVQTGQRDSL